MDKPKLILVGEGHVGKTSIIQQFIEQKFSESYLMTVGSDKSIKDLKINGKDIKLEIWDTAGQDKYRGVNKIFWIDNVKEINKNENIIFGVAANKSDLFEQQVVETEEGKKFANDNNCLFFETSAKDYKSIENAFSKLAENYIEKIENKNNETNNNNINNNSNNINNNQNSQNKSEGKKDLNFENELNEKFIDKDDGKSSCSKCFIF